MAFPIPTPSLLISALVVISAVSVTARELRPSDHGLEYQDDPSSPTSNPKPPPGMLSFFGASTSTPSPENAGGGIPKEADSSDLSINSLEKHDHVKDALLVASLAGGAAGVALLMASGLLFLFKYRKDRIGSGNALALPVTRPMQPLSPTQKLAGKVALITGGASGIGKTTASMFVEHGAKVVIADVQDKLGISIDSMHAKGGSILFTASMCTVCSGCPYAYMASKHGIVGMAKNLALELGAHGIRVNCISPFCVVTPMLKNALGMEDTKKVEEGVSTMVTLKGVCLEPKDIANAALYLASDESKYVSGINLVVDDGFSNTNSVSLGAILSLHGNI